MPAKKDMHFTGVNFDSKAPMQPAATAASVLQTRPRVLAGDQCRLRPTPVSAQDCASPALALTEHYHTAVRATLQQGPRHPCIACSKVYSTAPGAGVRLQPGGRMICRRRSRRLLLDHLLHERHLRPDKDLELRT